MAQSLFYPRMNSHRWRKLLSTSPLLRGECRLTKLRLLVAQLMLQSSQRVTGLYGSRESTISILVSTIISLPITTVSHDHVALKEEETVKAKSARWPLGTCCDPLARQKVFRSFVGAPRRLALCFPIDLARCSEASLSMPIPWKANLMSAGTRINPA